MVIVAAAALLPAGADADVAIDEITVTSQRRTQALHAHPGNVAPLDRATIDAVAHQHAHELLGRVAGTWISRGSGQEHLTAIRSPVLTGAGSCGSFLMMEDGIPIRPAGFCNVNQLFEINTEQADRIEVIRGPGTALFGSNAMHGIINVLTATSDTAPAADVALDAGANNFGRIRAQLSTQDALLSLLHADDGGFREASGYRQTKMHLKSNWQLAGGTFNGAFSASDLQQETAGFIVGEDAYRDPAVNRSNPNPEAFRDADSQRLYGIWKKSLASLELDLRPYVRHSDMRFLQHFLPGQPLEENGHISAGIISTVSIARADSTLTAGVDIEWSDMFLRQTQDAPTTGSAFLQETRPQGKHYDYDVSGVNVSPWLQFDHQVSSKFSIGSGIRLERQRYRYTNNMLSGNTRDDGSECGFGGCLYSRPDSRSDTFHNLAPKLGATLMISPDTSLFVNVARGFRAPQTTELYRLQSGQLIAELESERLDSAEIGFRSYNRSNRVELAVFAMKKRGSVLRDSEGFNISSGRSKHIGAETSFDWQIADSVTVSAAASYARHSYDFDLVASRGETFTAGNDIDTAPRWLGSAEVVYDPPNPVAVAMQWTMIGKYYVDAENRFSYPGHELLNIRGWYQFNERVTVTARLNNALDAAIADRADYAFGNFRYFPGRGRELFVELHYQQ